MRNEQSDSGTVHARKTQEMKPLTIASYNVQIPTMKTEEHNWDDRKRHLLPSLHQLGDILALQEVSYINQGQGEAISEVLTARGFDSYQPAHVPSNFTDEYHERIPVFWKASKFKLLSRDQIMLSSGTEEERQDYPNQENRYCVYVQLQDIRNPKNIYHVFNLHQQQVPDDVSQELVEHYTCVENDSLHTLEAFIIRKVAPGGIVFALGDFNMNHPLIEGLHCARRAAEHKLHNEYDSYHAFTIPLPRGRKNIDHIHTNMNASQLVSYETCIQYPGSDHHPIRVQFTD